MSVDFNEENVTNNQRFAPVQKQGFVSKLIYKLHLASTPAQANKVMIIISACALLATAYFIFF